MAMQFLIALVFHALYYFIKHYSDLMPIISKLFH